MSPKCQLLQLPNRHLLCNFGLAKRLLELHSLIPEKADACKFRAAVCCVLRPLSSVFVRVMSPRHCQVAEYVQVKTPTPDLTLNYKSGSAMLTNCDLLLSSMRKQTRAWAKRVREPKQCIMDNYAHM